MNDLLKEIKKLDIPRSYKKLSMGFKEETKEQKLMNTIRRPCKICEEMGFKSRFHPVQLCRNKKPQPTKLVNLLENDEDSENERKQKN